MKKHHFSLLYSLVISLVVIVSPIISATNQTDSTSNQDLSLTQKEGLKVNLMNNITKIANLLISNAVQDNVSGLKWDKYYNLTDNSASEFYYGYYYGAAGIGDYFTNLYRQTKNETYLTIAIQAYEFINAHAITQGPFYTSEFNSSGYVFWTRSIDSITVYTGIKYGNAGIAKFLCNLYLNTMNTTYLDLAKKSLNTLIYISIDASSVDQTKRGIYWGYSLFGDTPITDIIYGNAGIASAFLDLYKITKNQTYLIEASKSLEYIMSESEINNNSTRGQRFVRFSPDPSYPFAFTGYLTGTSGVGSILLDYYLTTKNNDYLLFSRQIGNWLAAKESNGFWKTGGADLLTENMNEAGSYTGFGAGSAGIGIFLLDLYNVTQDSTYLKPIIDITNMFSKEAITTGNEISYPIQKVDSQSTVIQTDLKMGLAGIGLYFSALYHYFGLNDSVNVINGILNYLTANTDKNGIIPTTIGLGTTENTNYDLSVLEGLTGIADFYLTSFKSLNTSSIFNPAVYTSGKKSNSIAGFELVPALLVCIVLTKRKRKSHS